MTADRLQDALSKAFRMGACSIHVPDQAERINADFARFVLDEVAAISTPQAGDAALQGMIDAWRASASDSESQGYRLEAQSMRICAADLAHHLRHRPFKVQPKGTVEGHKLAPLEPTPQMRKAAADAWLDCDSKLILNKAAAALRAGIAVAPTEES